jgi:hypothetical protein
MRNLLIGSAIVAILVIPQYAAAQPARQANPRTGPDSD